MILGYNLEKWQKYGLKYPIEVCPEKYPHVLLTGASGSGKSYALKWILKNLVQSQKIELTFCNFKDSSDFRFLKECPNCKYYVVDECINGFKSYYQAFKEDQSQAHEYDGVFHLIIFDEFPAFISWVTMLDKKQATQVQSQLSEMLMLSRSYGYGLWIICQRPDSAIFGSSGGARDNFFITISLGNISKEAKSMMFSGFEIEEQIFSVGEGISKIDGSGCISVKYPRIKDIKNLEQQILDGLAKPSGEP